MSELMVLLGILLIPILIFVPPHLIIWVAQGLFGVDWSDNYWYVFAGWVLLKLLMPSSRKSES